uniref:Uncharacterized protein AlNc14C19G2023 n=1 Tax=Albugo laibachii Nc14 TaxID=890382 RepID=F0W552_9STRA|nr:conserved hypothetical protein [Albugo laibachii Nc14]|eukprot:CCA16243.1 conserved hypothetical protein [Albugo laibachii Nc14]
MNLSSLWQYECERVEKLVESDTQTFSTIFQVDLQSSNSELSSTPSTWPGEADSKLSRAQARFIDMCTIPRIPEHMMDSVLNSNEFMMEYADTFSDNARAVASSQAAMIDQSPIDLTEKRHKSLRCDTKSLKELDQKKIQRGRKANQDMPIVGQRRTFEMNRDIKRMDMSKAHEKKVLRLSKIKSTSSATEAKIDTQAKKEANYSVALLSNPGMIHSKSESSLNRLPLEITPQHCRTLLRSYSGDIFGTRGDYDDGMLYMSRMHKNHPEATIDQEKQPRNTKIGSVSGNSILKEAFIGRFPSTPPQTESLQHKAISKSTPNDSKTDAWIDISPEWRHVKRLQQCAIALKNWSHNPQNAEVMMRENAVESLLRLCQLSHDGSSVPLIKNDIAQQPEKDQVESSSQTLGLCVSALVNMTYVKEVRPYMISKATARVIGEIANTSRDTQVRLNCAVILCNLCAVDSLESHAQLIADGITNTLYYLLSETKMESYIPMLALYNLTCVRESFTKLDIVLNTLLNIISTEFVTTLMDGQKPHVDARCNLLVKGMCNLSNFRTMRQRLMEEGATTAVVNLTQPSLVECYCMLAYVLQNLSMLKSYRASMVAGGCLDSIKAFVRNLDRQTTSKNSFEVPKLKFFTAMTLYNLSKDRTNHSRMIKDGVVNQILPICDAGAYSAGEDHKWIATQLVFLCSAMLYNISCNKMTRLQLVESQVVLIASKLFDTQKAHASISVDTSTSSSNDRSDIDSETIQMCTFTLCNLLTVPQATAAIAHTGAINSVIEMSYTASTLQTRYLVATALGQLCYASQTQQPVAMAGAVKALMYLCYPCEEKSAHLSPKLDTTVMLDGNLSDDESAVLNSIRIQCVAAITSLTMGTESDAVIAHTGPIIHFLAQILSEKHTTEVLEKLACLCLSLLSNDDASTRVLIQEQVVSVIIRNTFNSEDTEVKAAYCHILACISRHDALGPTLLDSGILNLLSGVARLKIIKENQDQSRDKSTLQRYCSIILANLARCRPSSISILSSQERIELVMRILPILSINSYSEEIQSNIVNVVAHFSAVPDSENHLAEMGAVELLLTIAMVRSLNPATRQACLGALCNLISSKTLPTLIQQGMIDLIPQFIAFDSIECIRMVTYIVEKILIHEVDPLDLSSFFESASLRAFLVMIVRSSSSKDVNLCITHEHLLLTLVQRTGAQIETLVPNIVDAVSALSARPMEFVDDMVASYERLALVMHKIISNPTCRKAAFSELSVDILLRFVSPIDKLECIPNMLPAFTIYAAGTLSYFAADSETISKLKSEIVIPALAKVLEGMIKSLNVEEERRFRLLLNGISQVLYSLCCLYFKNAGNQDSALIEATDILPMMEKLVVIGARDSTLVALVCILTRRTVHTREFFAKDSSICQNWSGEPSECRVVSLFCNVCEAAASDLESALDSSEILCDVVFGMNAFVSLTTVQDPNFNQKQLVSKAAFKSISMLMMETQLFETRLRCVASIAALSSYEALRSGLIRFDATKLIGDQALLHVSAYNESESIVRDILTLCAITIFNLTNSSTFAADADVAPVMISQGAMLALTHISSTLGSDDEVIATICTNSLSNLSNGLSLIENGAIAALLNLALDSNNIKSTRDVKSQFSKRLRSSLTIPRPQTRLSERWKDLVQPPIYPISLNWHKRSTAYKRQCNLHITESLPPQGLLQLHKSLGEIVIDVVSRSDLLSPVREMIRNANKQQILCKLLLPQDQIPVLRFYKMDVREYELQIKGNASIQHASDTINAPAAFHIDSSPAVDEQLNVKTPLTDFKSIEVGTLADESRIEALLTNTKKSIRLRKSGQRKILERIEETQNEKQNAIRKHSICHVSRK